MELSHLLGDPGKEVMKDCDRGGFAMYSEVGCAGFTWARRTVGANYTSALMELEEGKEYCSINSVNYAQRTYTRL